MEFDIGKITENYGERMRRIGLFSFLFEPKSKSYKDADGGKIDTFDMNVLALLFFFENMLMRSNKVSSADLAHYLKAKACIRYNLTEEICAKIAGAIITTFRPASGVRPDFTYFDWENNREEKAQYSILKRTSADLSTNTQYYTLGEDGLALVFATKEYFSEFQISINQLLLRKQLEKGEFVSALRQIDEMHVEVLSLKERILKIKQDIQRNIVSDDTYNRYKSIVEDIGSRLKRENQEFSELMTYVKSLQEQFGADVGILNEKDRQSYYLINKIDIELDKVHFEHKKLLDESLLLEKSALLAARESIYFAGIDAFNFNQEINGMIFSLPIPANEVRTVCEPFLFLERKQSFNLMRIFAEQRIEVQRSGIEEAFIEPTDEKEYMNYLKKCSTYYESIMKLIIKIMDGRTEIELYEVIEGVKELEPNLLDNRDFFQMFIVLHQKSPLLIGHDQDDKTAALFSGVSKVLGAYKSIHLTETANVLEINNVRIQNMIISFCLKED